MLTRRLAAAWKAAVGVFSDDSARQAHGMLAGLFPTGAGPPPTKGARERVAAYADMPWLHAIADKVASGLAAVEWTLSVQAKAGVPATRAKAAQRAPARERRVLLRRMKVAGELREIDSHPMLDLLDGGNALMTGLAVRKVTALHWDLEGEAFWLKERNGVGAPVAVWPLPPDWVRALPTPATRAFRVGFRGWQGEVPDTEILWLPNHDPANPYGRGSGLARALADELETDEYAAKSMRQSFLNQARPDFVVFPKGDGTLQDEQLERLRADWEAEHAGFWRAFRPRFASRELGVYEFKATDFRQLQMVQLREFERDLVRQVWGVPPEIMGIVEPGSSRATIQRAGYVFAQWVLVPRLEMLRALLQERLAPEFDERLIVDYVSPVEDDAQHALEVGKVAPWSRSVDEWRALGDLEPLADGRGKRYLVPANVTPQADFDAAPAAPAALEPPPSMGSTPAERAVLRRLRRMQAAQPRAPLARGKTMTVNRGAGGLIESVTVREGE